MSFEDALRSSRKFSQSCRVEKAFQRLKPQDRTALRTALDDGTIPASVVERALNKELPGLNVSIKGVLKHRKKECSCRY